MNRFTKVLSLIVISILLSSLIFINNSYAADDPIIACKISTFIAPNNPVPGQEVNIDISINEIKVPVAGVGFTLNYDQNLFDFVSINSDNGWNKVDRADLTFMCYQESLEAVTTSGKVATIKLKVKDNASPTKTTVGLKGIQVALDNNQPLKFGDRSIEITITANQQNQNNNNNNQNNNNQNNNNQNNNNQNNNNQNNNNQNNNNQNNNNQNNNNNNGSQYIPPEIDNNKIVTINGNNNNSNNSSTNVNKSTDNTATTKKLPKTGKATTVLLIITVVAGTIFGVISFRKYRKV